MAEKEELTQQRDWVFVPADTTLAERLERFPLQSGQQYKFLAEGVTMFDGVQMPLFCSASVVKKDSNMNNTPLEVSVKNFEAPHSQSSFE